MTSYSCVADSLIKKKIPSTRLQPQLYLMFVFFRFPFTNGNIIIKKIVDVIYIYRYIPSVFKINEFQ